MNPFLQIIFLFFSPSPSTKYHPPSTKYRQPNTIYRQPNTIYRQPNTVYRQPNTVYRQPNTVYRQPNTIYRQSNTIYRQPNTVYRQPNTKYRQPNTVYRQPNTIYHPPSTIVGYDEINRQPFYKAMQEDNKDLVNAELTEVKKADSALQEAFTGALLMKKAGLGGSPTTKLSLFKQGHKMLEAAIRKDSANAEFRFLRLMIQEHAPGILGYKNDLEKDSLYIKKMYKSLPVEVQRAIAGYSKKSKYLNREVS